MTKAAAKKSGGKSGGAGTFAPGADPRRGKGPKPGAPNAGRPPSEVRASFREAFAKRLPALEDIADGKVVQRIKVGGNETEGLISADAGERIRAIDVMGKYGLGALSEVPAETVQEKLRATLQLLRDTLPKAQAEAIIARMRDLWQ